MTDNTEVLDLAQRIAAAVARTDKPKASAAGSKPKKGQPIGTVPIHLQHLHNLLAEVGEDTVSAELEFRRKKRQHDLLHALFFDSLKTQAPSPEDSDGVTILEDWSVVANFESDEEPDLLDALFASVLGRRR